MSPPGVVVALQISTTVYWLSVLCTKTLLATCQTRLSTATATGRQQTRICEKRAMDRNLAMRSLVCPLERQDRRPAENEEQESARQHAAHHRQAVEHTIPLIKLYRPTPQCPPSQPPHRGPDDTHTCQCTVNISKWSWAGSTLNHSAGKKGASGRGVLGRWWKST